MRRINCIPLLFLSTIWLQAQSLSVGINPNAVTVDIMVPEHGMADPHAWVQNDTVFAICGHDQSWDAISSFPMDRWEIWSSVDLKNWNYHRSILPTQTYIGDKPNCWAGDICERNGKYYWFFSNRNLNTGVMVADKIDGEYRDLLGQPLLPEGIVPVHPYDPEIYIEDEVYTICFGQGTYYMATLADDMKSLKTKPKLIEVADSNGTRVFTDDKPTLFKRDNWYYLVYGDRYAMSENLYGPYIFKGKFLKGGHTSFFWWKDQLYVLQENHDISAFYRGTSVKPVFFNDDSSILIPNNDRMYPGPGRAWRFERSTMGWKPLSGTTIILKEPGTLAGEISMNAATIESAPWLYTDTRDCSKILLTLKNSSEATELKIALYTRDKNEPNFWTTGTGPVDWDNQQWLAIPIGPNSLDFTTYTIELNQFNNIHNLLMRMALQPASNAAKGLWEIKNIKIE